MHKIFELQLEGKMPGAESSPEDWNRFIELVGAAYQQAEEDRARLQQALELNLRALTEKEIQSEAERAERRLIEEALQRSLRRAVLLNRVISTATSTLDPDAVLNTVCTELAQAVSVPQAFVALLDPNGKTLRVVSEYISDAYRSVLNRVLDLEDNESIARLLKQGTPLVIGDVHSDPIPETLRNLLQRRGATSAIIVPLLIRGHAAGVLELDALEPREFTAEEIDLVRDIAAATSQAIENAQLYAAAQRELNERQNTERMLHYSEEKTLAILEDIDAYFEADLTGYLTYVNGPFCEAVQYSREEVLGRHYRHYTDRRFIRKIFEAFNTIYRTGEPQDGVIYNLLRRNGDTGYAEANISLMRDLDGKPIGFRGILRDVTERLRMEAELRKAKEAAEGELEIGRQIQAGFLPEQLPQPQGWEINGHFRPAREVAGDFYDAFLLARGSMMGIVIADVCGKGVGAALFMALVRSLVRAYANHNFSQNTIEVIARGQARAATTLAHRSALIAQGVMPATSAVLKDAVLHTITETNDYIATNHGKANMFATLFLGVLDHASGLLTYVNGGHDAPVVTGEGIIRARLDPTGPAIGMLPDMEFKVHQVYLEPGDTLVMYTDGVVDARNPRGDFFGEPQLLSLLARPAESAGALLQALDVDLKAHIANASQFDDITMLAVRRTAEFEWEQQVGANDTHGNSLKLEISRTATLENLPVLRQFVEDACLQAGLSEDATFAFKLAVDEVCTNIVTHGYKDLEAGSVDLIFQLDALQVAITIADRGHPFNPDQSAMPDLEAGWEERQIGGLGLYFVHELMDHVSYWSDPAKGNRLTLIKRHDTLSSELEK